MAKEQEQQVFIPPPANASVWYKLAQRPGPGIVPKEEIAGEIKRTLGIDPHTDCPRVLLRNLEPVYNTCFMVAEEVSFPPEFHASIKDDPHILIINSGHTPLEQSIRGRDAWDMLPELRWKYPRCEGNSINNYYGHPNDVSSTRMQVLYFSLTVGPGQTVEEARADICAAFDKCFPRGARGVPPAFAIITESAYDKDWRPGPDEYIDQHRLYVNGMTVATLLARAMFCHD